jgi:hypothetical protein
MVSLTGCTFGLATGTGAAVGAWATAVPLRGIGRLAGPRRHLGFSTSFCPGRK